MFPIAERKLRGLRPKRQGLRALAEVAQVRAQTRDRAVQWSPNSPDAGTTGSASLVKDPACFAMTYPANTVTRVAVTLE